MEFREWTNFDLRDTGLHGGSVNSGLIVNHLVMFCQWLKIGMLHATLDAGVDALPMFICQKSFQVSISTLFMHILQPV